MIKFQSRFDAMEFPEYLLMFDLGHTEDERGIGRVSRPLREAWRCASERRDTTPVPSVYFFPSIHWWPDILSNRSIVMIHDTTPSTMWHFFHQDQDEWLYDFAAVATQAERIVTISRSSRENIRKHLLVESRRILVVYSGITVLGRRELADPRSGDYGLLRCHQSR
jgi:Glycosyltransferase Family 4